MNSRVPLALLCSTPLFLAACHKSDDPDPIPTSAATSSYDATFAVAWLDRLYAAIKASGAAGFSPPVASRAIGYSGVAFYEALVHGMEGHRSLGGQINGLGALPAIQDGAVYHWPTAANRAVATVLESLFAAAPAQVLTDIQTLEAQFETQFDGENAADVSQRSLDLGDDIAATILAWAAADGFATWNNCSFTPPVGPGLWVPTGAVTSPLQPCWGNMRTFALLYSAECAPLPHPPYSTSSTSAFYAEAAEVQAYTTATMTQAEKDIASFWADGGGTGTPPGHWISIVAQVCEQHALTLDVAAEAYARVGIAVADAFIACWEMKYYYNLLRPQTYIRDPAALNDPTWTPFIATPPFPEYTSGHSTQSGAASVVLRDLLGDLAFTDDTHAGTWPARSFTSFVEAADEAAISRLYGGIHYRAAIDRGVDQGRCIGNVILDSIAFRE